MKTVQIEKLVILDDLYDCASEKNLKSILGDNRVLHVKANLQDAKTLRISSRFTNSNGWRIWRHRLT